MKYLFLLSFLWFLATSTGCNSHENKSSNDTTTIIWNRLIIRSEGGPTVDINDDNDSSIVKIYPVFDFFSPAQKKTYKIKTLKVYFTTQEKDTLFHLAKDIILNPVKPHSSCTEFIGHLELFIDYGQFKQSGEYTSVCNWTSLSDKTMHLHRLLKKRIKGVYLGED
jgi:hypothetical protein